MAKDILVFRDLTIRGKQGDLPKIRTALLDQVTMPWKHAEEREEEISSGSLNDDDVIMFSREQGNGIEAVGLLLWSRGDSYQVTNIVPRNVSQLGYEAYNAALNDFVERIAKPASHAAGFRIETTPERQSLTDWVSSDVAEALRRFSVLANKSTGSSHPSDRQRWFEFLFAAHGASEKLDADRLIRWLSEVENWPEDTAHDLAIQYELGLDLLKAYDENRM